jgi:hypothetical protein
MGAPGLPTDARMLHIHAALRLYAVGTSDPDDAVLAQLYSHHIAAIDLPYSAMQRASHLTRLVERAMDVYPVPDDDASRAMCTAIQDDFAAQYDGGGEPPGPPPH